MLFGWVTYMHIFFLFPCLFYIIVIASNGAKQITNHNVRVFMAVLAIIVLISHAINAMGWLAPSSTFINPISTSNVLYIYSRLTLNSKIVVLMLSCCSIFIFYNLFTIGSPKFLFSKSA